MDIDYPGAALLALSLCLVGGLAWGVSTSGAAFDPYNYDWDGTSDLRTNFDDDADVTLAHSTAAYDDTQAAGTAAVVIEPGGRYSAAERARLSSFVARGGTLVVAASSPESNGLLADVGTSIRVDGAPVRDEQSYDRDPALPQATGVSGDDRVRGVDMLTLNHGTTLDAGDGTPLVNTSAVAYPDDNRNGELDANETLGSYPVMATDGVGSGAVIVVSDPSILTNAMLEREGNRQFVRNLAVDHDRLLLDYSQQDGFPPLSYAVLLVRTTPLLRLLLGGVTIAAVAVAGRVRLYRRLQGLWRRVRGRAGERRRESEAGRAPAGEGLQSLDESTLSAVVADRYPDWDERRRQRVTEAIIRRRQQEGDND